MRTTPKVSVVLPTYNRAATLSRSVESVLCQSFKDFELIIIDDASEDETPRIVDSFEDQRIRYLRNRKNFGAQESRNLGIRNARGELIAFQDSDDEWRVQKLEKCLSELKKNKNLSGVYSGFWQINGKRVRYMPLSKPLGKGKNMKEALLWGNFVDTPTVVVHKSALELCGGFDKDIPGFDDWELFIRLSEKGAYLFIKEPLILSYCSPDSISANNFAKKLSLERIYKKNRSRIKGNSKLEASWRARMGDAQMRTGSEKVGRKNLALSVINNPLNIRYALKALFALPGNRNMYINMNKIFEKKW